MTLSTSLVAVWYSSDSWKSRVLDRDDRLVGKGAYQFDLPFVKRLDPFPPETNRAEHGPLAQQRHPKGSTYPGLHSLGQREVRGGGEVLDMHDSTFERHPSGDVVATGDNGSLAHGRPTLGVCCTV